MLNVLCENKKNTLLEINSLLQAVTRMDSISDMVKSVGKQTEALHTIASNREQLTASIEEVAGNSQQMSESASDVQQISNESINNITESIEFVTKSFEEIAQINVQMHNLKEKTDAINQIVDIVKGIADQTNFLSLNAAIEVARAGEQGRGFAVVADEVRKLSKHRKISVNDIQKNVSALQKDLDNSVDRISDTVAHLDSGKQLVNSALSSINLIGTLIETLKTTAS